MSDPDYTFIRPFEAEGGRVGYTTCKRCGAAVIVDGSYDIDPLRLHDDWHSSGASAPPTPSPSLR